MAFSSNKYTIIKTFRLSETKYDNYNYYTIYQMFISMLSSIFDKELIENKKVMIKKKVFYYYFVNNDLYQKHNNLIEKCSTKKLLKIDYID